MPEPLRALTFRMAYRKEGQVQRAGKMRLDEERFASLPDVPPQLNDVSGAYSTVSAESVKLNDAQLRSGFLDYLFFPEVVTAVSA